MNGKKFTALVLFALVTALNLIGNYLDIPLMEYITKPMLMPLILLNALFELEGSRAPKWLNPLLILALCFHCAGDVFLMIPGGIFGFFAAGLAAFLIGHIFYITIFVRSGVFHKVGALSLIIVILATMASILALVLIFKFEGVIKWPVFIYGSMLLFVSMCGFSGVINLRKPTYWYAALGALLFLFSDFMVAWRSLLGHTFPGMGFWIMLTYISAECLIVTSIVKSNK